jgi:hypothetical protein
MRFKDDGRRLWITAAAPDVAPSPESLAKMTAEGFERRNVVDWVA